MSSKFNFDKYDEYLKNNNKEEKEVEVMENKKINNSVTKDDLKQEADILEKRIYGLLKPYFKKIDDINNNIQKLALDKEVSGIIKDLKKKGYTFQNEDEILEQLEVDYLRGLEFKFNKVEVK